MMAVRLPNQPSFLVRDVPKYIPHGISLMTVYRWIQAGKLDVVGPPHKFRVTRDSLLKILSQF